MIKHSIMAPVDATGTPLTEAELLRLLGGERVEWDGRLPGFGLRHRASGGRSWFLLTRVEGKLTRLTFGAASRVSEAQARKKAMLHLLSAKTGGDPMQPVIEARNSPTFAEHARRYWRDCTSDWKPSTFKTNSGYRDRYLLPAFKRLHLDQITPALVQARYVTWSKRYPGAADRALQIMSQMFTKAEDWGEPLPWGNPCKGFTRNKRRVIGRHLTEAELWRVGVALDELEARYPYQVGVVRVLLFTGCRIGEVLALRWDSMAGPDIYVGTSKTGPRRCTLNDMTAEVLRRIPRKPGNPHMFPKPGSKPGHRVSINSFWNNQLLPRAGIDKLRRHDLRHTFASYAAMGEENTPIIAKLLGHSGTRNTHRYLHLADKPAIEAAEKIGEILGQALEAGKALAIGRPTPRVIVATRPASAKARSLVDPKLSTPVPRRTERQR